MKSILKWLETKFSRHSATIEADERHTPVGVRVRPAENAKDEYSIEFGLDLQAPERVENQRQAKDVPMPDKYVCDDTVAQRQLNILNESPLDATGSAGVDPYNTGRIDTSRVWNSRSRK